jgi:hypothetical protein
MNVNVPHTGTKITALAEISSAQPSAPKYLSMMPMRPAHCIQRQYIVYLLNVNIFITGTKITALVEIS